MPYLQNQSDDVRINNLSSRQLSFWNFHYFLKMPVAQIFFISELKNGDSHEWWIRQNFMMHLWPYYFLKDSRVIKSINMQKLSNKFFCHITNGIVSVKKKHGTFKTCNSNLKKEFHFFWVKCNSFFMKTAQFLVGPDKTFAEKIVHF